MAQEIKVVLATEMKAAGIKATEEQVERLSEKLDTMNKKGSRSANDLLTRFGRLPGLFGRIQSVLTGTAAKIAFSFGAATVGITLLVRMGTLIWDKIIKPLKTMADLGKTITFTSAIKEIFGVTNATKEAEEAAKMLKAEQENAAKKAYDGWSKAFSEMEKGWDKANKAAKENITAIDDAIKAYLKMQAAQERVTSADDSGVVLGLKRTKFDEMAAAKDADEAALIGAKYDILIAEEEAKQKIAKFDEKAANEAAELLANEQELLAISEKKAKIEEQYKDAIWEASKVGVSGGGSEPSKADDEAKLVKIEAQIVELKKKKIDLEKRYATGIRNVSSYGVGTKQAKDAVNENIATKKSIEEIDTQLSALRDKYGEIKIKLTPEGQTKEAENAAKAKEKAAEALAKKEAELDAVVAEEKAKREEIAAKKLAASALEQERDNIRDQNSLDIAEKRKAQEDLIKGQADKKRKAEEEQYKKEQDEYEARLKREERETRDAQRKIADERIAAVRKELSIRKQQESEAKSWHSEASSNLSAAWRTYRDPNAMKSEIQEYRDQKKAEQRFERDLASLESRNKNWRTAEFGTLSARDEAVKRVALAREEEEAAKQAMMRTAENTKDLADKLDELLQMKGQ